MTTLNIKRKKKSNNLSDRKKIQLFKDSIHIKPLPNRQLGGQAEEEIKTLKQQMEFILGVTKTGLDIIDSEFNIRYIDPEWAKVYGDPSGKKCYQYFMDRSEICPRCGIPIALKTKTVTVTEEILVKERNRPIQVTTIPFQNAKGEWLLAEVNVDISERKRAEEALIKAHEELEMQVQKRTAELIQANEAMQIEIAERKRAEEKLRESEEKHRTIIGSIEDAYYEVDLAGNFTFFNDSLCRMLGYSRDELMGMNNRQYTDQENSKKLYLAFNKVYRTGNPTMAFDWQVIRRNGEKRFGEVSIALIKDSNGRPCGFRGIARDITERKRAEEAILVANERLQYLLSFTSAVIYTSKISEDYGATFISNNVIQMTGYEPQEFLENSSFWIDHIHPEDKKRILAELPSVFEKGYHIYEYRFLNKDNTYRWMRDEMKLARDQKGNPIEIIGFWIDITDRKQVEEKYRTILRTTMDGFWIANMQGRFLDVNDAYCRMIGYSRDELLTMSISDVEVVERPEDTARRIQKIMELGGDRFETLHKSKDGRVIDIEVSVNYMEAGDGVMFVFLRDITDRKQAEEALKESQEKFRFLAEKMADIVWTTDLNFRTTFVSASIEKVLGFTPEEREKQSLEQMITPESLNRVQSMFLEELQREEDGVSDPDRSLIIEVEYYRKDGSIIWMENTIKAMRDAAGTLIGIYGVSRDITERRQSEEALRKEKQRFQTLSENAPFGMVMIDQEGTLKYMNPQFRELFGYDLFDAPDGRTWFRKAYPDPAYRHHVIAQWMKDLGSFERGERIPRIFTAICKDGTKKTVNFVSVRLETGEYLMTCEDITERKQSEEALHTEKQRFQTLSDQAPFGMVMIDHDGTFRYINPKFRELFGYDLTDIPDGKTWFTKAYPNPTYRHDVIGTWINDLKSSKPGEKRSRIFIVTCKDGTEKTINFIPVQLAAGENLMACEDITERKRAEEALRESERKYRELADFLPEMVYESDEKGKILFSNRCGFETFGYSQEDFDKGLKIFQMIIPENREKVKENFEMLLKGKPSISHEYTALRKDGSTFPVIASANPIIHDNKSIGARGIVINITQRKRAEADLQESEEKYRLLVENAGEAIFVAQDGMLKFVNQNTTEIIGYSKEELTSKPFHEFIHPDDRGMVLDRHLKRLKGQELPSVYPFRIVNKSGDFKWVELNAVIVNWNGKPATLNFLSDITERKRAEEALKESQQLLKKTFASLHDAVFIIDAETARIMDCNPAASEMFGYAREEMVGQPTLFLHVNNEALQEFRTYMYASVEEKGFLSLPEFGMKRENGELFSTEHSVVPLENDQGERIGWVSVVRDITERKRAEKKMAELQEQLRQSQKIEAIGRLGGGIAHDFNNLLTIIKGYSQLSLLDLKENDPLFGNIQEIKKATQRATDLTRQLLAFSRRQILDLKVLDLNTLLRDLDKMLRRIIGEDIELVTLLAEDLGRVKIDSGQIEQVIFNLAVNARDAMPSGGKLIIETANVELDEEYASAHIGVVPGRYVRLSVSDTGVGIPQEMKEKIFEPFFTTKEKGKGTGLGLSTVYGIVKQIGGNIWVYSEPGHGTTFKIYLPWVEEELDTLHGRDETDSLPMGSETVLLVEDEASVRDLAHRILSQQGYKVLEAANGEEALRVFQEHMGEKIHLLLTDVVMPLMGGKELAERLKILSPDIKVLYTSGYTDDAIVHQGVLNPGTHFLQKPSSPKTLSHKVREVLDG
jgi:two-component system cell cycle sensor histidine kinase/response regulator CckA